MFFYLNNYLYFNAKPRQLLLRPGSESMIWNITVDIRTQNHLAYYSNIATKVQSELVSSA